MEYGRHEYACLEVKAASPEMYDLGDQSKTERRICHSSKVLGRICFGRQRK